MSSFSPQYLGEKLVIIDVFLRAINFYIDRDVFVLKKKGVLLVTSICIFLITFCSVSQFQGTLMGYTGIGHWDTIRLFTLSIIVSLILLALVVVFPMRKALFPYYRKFIKFRPLLYQLVRRDFLAKYKRSALGILWSLLNPLLTMLVLTVVFSFLFRFDIENFPVYLLSGQIIFTLFSEVTNLCMGSITGAAALMKKVSVPKYIFPLSRALSSLVNFGFSLIALVLVMLVTGAPFHLQMLYILIPVLYIFAFSVGVGLVLSAMVVFFRDITYLYGIVLTAVTYFTPLFYPISIIPDRFRWIISLNPLYHFVECFRTCAIYGGIPTVWQNLVCGLLAILSLGAGLFIFYRKQDKFILYI